MLQNDATINDVIIKNFIKNINQFVIYEFQGYKASSDCFCFIF